MLKEFGGILLEGLIASVFLAIALIGMTSVVSTITNEVNKARIKLKTTIIAKPGPLNTNCLTDPNDPHNLRLVCLSQGGSRILFSR